MSAVQVDYFNPLNGTIECASWNPEQGVAALTFGADHSRQEANYLALPGWIDFSLADATADALGASRAGLKRAWEQSSRDSHLANTCQNDGPLANLPMATREHHWQELGELASFRELGYRIVDAGECLPVRLDDLRRLMASCAQYGLRLAIRPLVPSLADGRWHAAGMSARYGLPAHYASAETIAIQTLGELARETGCAVHCKRLSSARGVVLLEQLQGEGLDFSADVAIASLFLSDVDFGDLDFEALTPTVLRSTEDRDALRDGVRRGIIGTICSEHRRVLRRGATPDAVVPGLATLEVTLPLVLRLGRELRMPLEQALGCLSSTPAGLCHDDIYAQTANSQIAESLVLIRRDTEFVLDDRNMQDPAPIRLGRGWLCTDQVVMTARNGEINYRAAMTQ